MRMGLLEVFGKVFDIERRNTNFISNFLFYLSAFIEYQVNAIVRDKFCNFSLTVEHGDDGRSG